jgi:hypothetical protein
MDRRDFLTGTAALALGTALAGCSTGSQNGPTPTPTSTSPVFLVGQRGASSVDMTVLRNRLAQFEIGDLSDTERADIFFMREEEKVARDVYLALVDEWGLQVHDNIADSEQSHMDAMLALVELYDLEDPATGTVGTFTNEKLQALHDDLVEWGQESRLDALKVGCRIEEKDIRDINVRIDRTDEPAIEMVYENLVRGSRNHLRAFYRVLTRRGGDYEPVIISQEQFDSIVESDWETGRD